MKTHHLAMVAAVFLAGFSTARGAEEVTCRRADLLVAHSREARLHACVIPGAGHDLNLTVNHRLQLADAAAWSAAFVERSVGSKRLRPGAMDVGLKTNDGLPANCGSARQNDGPGSRYARTSVTVP
jgi:hypothetical protein